VVACATLGLLSAASPSGSVTSPGATFTLIVAFASSSVTSTYFTLV